MTRIYSLTLTHYTDKESRKRCLNYVLFSSSGTIYSCPRCKEAFFRSDNEGRARRIDWSDVGRLI